MYKSLNAAASGVKEIYQTSQEKGKKKKSWAEKGKKERNGGCWLQTLGGGAKGARRVTHREPKERSLLGES